MSKIVEALRRIAALSPGTDSTEGYNEWGEADCFNQAQALARAALAEHDAQPQQTTADAKALALRLIDKWLDLGPAGLESVRQALDSLCAEAPKELIRLLYCCKCGWCKTDAVMGPCEECGNAEFVSQEKYGNAAQPAPAAQQEREGTPCFNCGLDSTGKVTHSFGCPNDPSTFKMPPQQEPPPGYQWIQATADEWSAMQAWRERQAGEPQQERTVVS